MKVLATAAVAGLTLFTSVNSAAAFSFSPLDTKFHLNVYLMISGPQGSANCRVQWNGTTKQTDRHGAEMVGAGFGGQTPPCGISSTGTPWPLQALGLHRASFSNLGFNSADGEGIGPCGPAIVKVKISANGVWKFDAATLPGGCTISGSIQSNPPITIVP